MERMFRKYQALLNDYVLFDATEDSMELPARTVVRLCHRRAGVGADGVLVVSREVEHFRMDILNSDGSPAAMCGNGLRCVGKFLADTGRIAVGETVPVRTGAGMRSVTVLEHTPQASRVAAGLGTPQVLERLELEGMEFWHVDVGNPHIVHFLDGASGDAPAQALAMALERGPRLEHVFSSGVNVGFACIRGEELELAVWERGAGFTEACGTGATAAVAAARASDRLVLPGVRVRQRGGDAVVAWTPRGEAVLEGMAHFVFSGNVFLDFPGGPGQQ